MSQLTSHSLLTVFSYAKYLSIWCVIDVFSPEKIAFM